MSLSGVKKKLKKIVKEYYNQVYNKGEHNPRPLPFQTAQDSWFKT